MTSNPVCAEFLVSFDFETSFSYNLVGGSLVVGGPASAPRTQKALGEQSSGRQGCLEICVASLARVPSAGLAGVRLAERAL